MNTTAKLGGIGAIFALLLTEVPEQYTLYVALFIIACGAVTALVPPPNAGSKWAVAYQLITTIGLNIGWAENHFKPGQSGVRVPLPDKPAAKQAVAAAGIPVLDRKGKPETPTP
ncbi:hypothetical protein K6L44_06230 [Gluconacetobacter entanii]|uniref:hypothetical protein n=1 Tax=Gluconacetobacter entanii TaxID=108528 RepID=UPI001C931A74|nr:hypothetical protein [Gluconacetobacter entanii]MBY4639598.1 hypothetical protein [Gluconacetobacter entanii]MCW4579207.1 hypothetical protein [Gluconacetobacter entanii]MCW4582596.1 hypothetical protein [Gluconacetobacter entanii]MCW4585995.1 hypothetical protein [Gluconacetobacter entanii]